MKIVDGFTLRDVMGTSVIIGEGTKQVNFNKLISLNESAALLWKGVIDKEFTNEDLAKILMDAYDIDHETALADASDISAKWLEQGIIE